MTLPTPTPTEKFGRCAPTHKDASLFEESLQESMSSLPNHEPIYLGDEDLSRALIVVIPEGQRVEQGLYLTPRADFLHLVHPQAIYHPDEPLRVGIRGFTQQDEMELELFRVKSPIRNPMPLFTFLSDLHYGWWRPEQKLKEAFQKVADQYERTARTYFSVSKKTQGVR